MNKEEKKMFGEFLKERQLKCNRDSLRKFVEHVCLYAITPEDVIKNIFKVENIEEYNGSILLTIDEVTENYYGYMLIQPVIKYQLDTDEYKEMLNRWAEELAAYDAYVDSIVESNIDREWDDQDPLYV